MYWIPVGTAAPWEDEVDTAALVTEAAVPVELALELVELEDEVEEVDVADELEEGTEEELQILTSFMKAVQLVSPCGSG